MPNAQNLGVILDSMLSCYKQVSNNHVSCIFQTCYSYIRRFTPIRQYSTRQAALIIGAAMVASRLNYRNSLRTSTADKNIKRLQHEQNASTRFVYCIPKMAHISPTLTRLHWLPIKQRINYKLRLLSQRAMQHSQPIYLTKLFGTPKQYSVTLSMQQ